MAISIETYALCKKFAKNYCDAHASTLTEEQAIQAVANYFNENPNAIVTNEELENVLTNYLTEHQDISGKLNILPNVEDENDPGYGYPYWIPYSFATTSSADGLDITLKTLTLDNQFLKHEFTNPFPVASTTQAGIMTAADKTKLDSALTEHQDINNKTDKTITGTNGQSLIFNESDGGGAKFEHTDGTWSFAGVNDGGADGLAAQVYAIDSAANKGVKLDIQTKGIYYTSGEDSTKPYSERDVEANEIAVKGDLSEYAKTTEVTAAVNTAVADLIDGAPETLDTLKEISDTLEGVASQTWVNSQGFITEHYTVTIDI